MTHLNGGMTGAPLSSRFSASLTPLCDTIPINMWLVTLLISIVLTLAISLFQYRQWSEKSNLESSPQLARFQRNYFIIYLLANGADWLQGPYVYALYESYGHDRDTIAILFVAGYFSSMLFGTFVGSLADI